MGTDPVSGSTDSNRVDSVGRRRVWGRRSGNARLQGFWVLGPGPNRIINPEPQSRRGKRVSLAFN